MRKTWIQVGLASLTTWLLMFVAFFLQMSYTAQQHAEGTAISPFTIILMAAVLFIALTICVAGYLIL